MAAHGGNLEPTRWPRPLVGLRGIGMADLPREVSAGLTLAALIIPLNIGYAQIAGLPPAMGLYAGIVPLIVFGLFTSSKNVIGGPGPTTAALVAAALVGTAAPGDPQRIQYALALALMCGGLFVLAWFFRLGYLQNFLSQAVMIGFVSGLGIQVFTSQLRKILGVRVDMDQEYEELAEQLHSTLGMTLDTQGYFMDAWGLIQQIPHTNFYALAVGLGSLVLVRLMKRFLPKVPGALVVLVLMTVIVAALHLDERGLRVLGDLPSGLPALTLPAIGFADYVKLLPGAFAIVAITLCEGLLLVGGYARKYGDKPDRDQVLFAYGLANAASGFTGSMVTGNSVSRSAAMDSSGARSQLPSLVAAVVLAAIMAFFTDSLALLPKAALAGIVANAVLSLIDFKGLKNLYRTRRSEFWIAAVCLLSVLFFGPLRAVVIAFLMSLIDVVSRASHPYTTVLRLTPDGDFVIPDDSLDMTDAPGLVVYRFSAPLFFANANAFLNGIEALVADSDRPVNRIVLSAEAILGLDTSGAQALKQAMSILKTRGVSLALSRVQPPLEERLRDYGLLDEIGEEFLYATNREAAAAFRKTYG
jgi:SulP family sulfate permease